MDLVTVALLVWIEVLPVAVEGWLGSLPLLAEAESLVQAEKLETQCPLPRSAPRP